MRFTTEAQNLVIKNLVLNELNHAYSLNSKQSEPLLDEKLKVYVQSLLKCLHPKMGVDRLIDYLISRDEEGDESLSHEDDPDSYFFSMMRTYLTANIGPRTNQSIKHLSGLKSRSENYKKIATFFIRLAILDYLVDLYVAKREKLNELFPVQKEQKNKGSFAMCLIELVNQSEKTYSDIFDENAILNEFKLSYVNYRQDDQAIKNLWSHKINVLIRTLWKIIFRKDLEPFEYNNLQLCSLPFILLGVSIFVWVYSLVEFSSTVLDSNAVLFSLYLVGNVFLGVALAVFQLTTACYYTDRHRYLLDQRLSFSGKYQSFAKFLKKIGLTDTERQFLMDDKVDDKNIRTILLNKIKKSYYIKFGEDYFRDWFDMYKEKLQIELPQHDSQREGDPQVLLSRRKGAEPGDSEKARRMRNYAALYRPRKNQNIQEGQFKKISSCFNNLT